MINKALFYELTGLTREATKGVPTPHLTPKPNQSSFYLLVHGFVYEVYLIEGARVVSWFWGDGDVVIPTSPYSTLIVGENATTNGMTHRDMFKTLREFGDFRKMYQEIRERHHQAVAERISDLRKLTPMENYIKLLEQKPWVLERADEKLVASYLRVSVNELRKFRNINA